MAKKLGPNILLSKRVFKSCFKMFEECFENFFKSASRLGLECLKSATYLDNIHDQSAKCIHFLVCSLTVLRHRKILVLGVRHKFFNRQQAGLGRTIQVETVSLEPGLSKHGYMVLYRCEVGIVLQIRCRHAYAYNMINNYMIKNSLFKMLLHGF